MSGKICYILNPKMIIRCSNSFSSQGILTWFIQELAQKEQKLREYCNQKE
jgi:hypothetical protein